MCALWSERDGDGHHQYSGSLWFLNNVQLWQKQCIPHNFSSDKMSPFFWTVLCKSEMILHENSSKSVVCKILRPGSLRQTTLPNSNWLNLISDTLFELQQVEISKLSWLLPENCWAGVSKTVGCWMYFHLAFYYKADESFFLQVEMTLQHIAPETEPAWQIF